MGFSFSQFEQILPRLGLKQQGENYIGPCPLCGLQRQYYQGFDQGKGVLLSIPIGRNGSACTCRPDDIERAWLEREKDPPAVAQIGQKAFSVNGNGALADESVPPFLMRWRHGRYPWPLF